MRLIQSAVNFSEGRDTELLARLAGAARGRPGVLLIDHSADPDHHRSVFTLLGEAEPLAEALDAMVGVAVEAIDLRCHRGQHPRIGAVDVIPFVPVGDTTLDDCVVAARGLGERIAQRYALPVYYYEAAALLPEHVNLADVRRGEFEALEALPALTGARRPDAGPGRVHPTAGAVAMGARGPLTAYNIVLHTPDVEIARRIAARVRERGGGLLGVKALGLFLESEHRAQVSLNVTRPLEVPLYRIFELVSLEAKRFGVSVAGSELIGAIRLEELLETNRYYLGLHGLKADQVLDLWSARLGDGSEGSKHDG